MKKHFFSILCVMVLLLIIPTSLNVAAAPRNTVKTSISKIESKAKGFKVTWKKKSKIKGYQVQYSTSSKFKKSATKTKTISKSKTRTATISKLKGCNKKYYVRVRTYKVVKGKKIYSSWSKSKKVTTLKHKYESATCTKAKTCKYCKKTSGVAYGHSWSPWWTISEAEVGKDGEESRYCYFCEATESKEIPSLQEDLTKDWFVKQYLFAEKQYKETLKENKELKVKDIDSLKELIDYEAEIYNQKMRDILNKYPPCETRNIMLRTASQNYEAAIRPYKDKISQLEEEIAKIDNENVTPNIDKVLIILIENCNISSFEAYQYYNKYASYIFA